MRPLRLWPVLVGLTAVLVSSGAAANTGGSNQSFPGQMFDAPGSRVKLTVEVRHGRAKGGRFVAQRIYLSCGDDLQSNDRATLPPTPIHFLDRNTFSADTYISGASTGVESYLHVIGDVNLRTGRAEGSLAAYVSPLPDSGGYEEPDCTTRGLKPWKAARKGSQSTV